MKISFDSEFSNDDAYYSSVVLSNFKTMPARQNDNVNGVAFNDSFSIAFSAPGVVTGDDIQVDSVTWMDFVKLVENTDGGDGVKDYLVTITYPAGETAKTTINSIKISTNKVSDSDRWADQAGTFAVAADEEPDANGSIIINVAGFEDLGEPLNKSELKLVFTRGSSSVSYTPGEGVNPPLKLRAGKWRLTGSNLATEDGTYRAEVFLDNKDFDLSIGDEGALNVTFGDVLHFTIIDIDTTKILNLDDIIDEDMVLNVNFTQDKYPKLRYTFKIGDKFRIDQLPVDAGVVASLQFQPVSLNNKMYTFKGFFEYLNGKNYYYNLDDKLNVVPHVPSNHVVIKLVVKAEPGLDTTFDLRLRHTEPDSVRRYKFTNIKATNGSTILPMELARGEYEILSKGFIVNGTLFYTDFTPERLVLPPQEGASLGNLEINIVKGANLRVKGFPDFLSFGGCASMVPSNAEDFAAARAYSLFKYAGNDGMGDANKHLPLKDEATPGTIAMAKKATALINEDRLPVLPVMISYTCNLSLGDTPNLIVDATRHMYSFSNYIQALSEAQKAKDEQYTTPAGFIVNPDYLGECQKERYLPGMIIPVRAPLEEALKARDKDFIIPDYIQDTLKGYVQAVNWLTRVIAPDVVLGWQVNMWGVGGSQWAYKDFEYEKVLDPETLEVGPMLINPFVAGKITAQYANLLGVFDDAVDGETVIKGADFMAVDRYEADDLTERSYTNGYCFAEYEWERLFDFCASLGRHLKKPIMPWQIPASHLPTTLDNVEEWVESPDMGFNAQFWGTGGTYLFGDANIGSSLSNIHPIALALDFPGAGDHKKNMGENVAELLSRRSWDMSVSHYNDFHTRGIFHVQLGGGTTTGIVTDVGNKSNWVIPRLQKYHINPIKLP